MRFFILPAVAVLLSLSGGRHDQIKVPGVPVTMLGSGEFKEDEEARFETKRSSASMKSMRSYEATADSLGLGATVTIFGSGLKFDRPKLRFSFAKTVWDYEMDTKDKQEILEEKETSFGEYPAYFLKMKVTPKDDEAYYFETYSIAIENKEVYVSASYYDDEDSQSQLKKWTESLEVDGKKRGELEDISD